MDLTNEAIAAAFPAGVPIDWSSPERQAWLNEAADMGERRIELYATYDDYYDGEHRVPLLDRAKEYLERNGLGAWSENYMETIVDIRADHLEVEGFQVDGNAAASKWLNDVVWRRQMDELQGVTHHELFKLGDAFVMVDLDDESGRPCARRRDPYRTKPVYGEDNDDLLYIVTVWESRKMTPTNPDGVPIRRMNLYFPERVEKWFAVGTEGAATWAPHLDPEDYEDVEQFGPETGEPLTFEDVGTGETLPVLAAEPVWPTPWTMDGTPEGEPIGINIVHFTHKSNGRPMGRSVLHGAIRQQDALTKDLLDLFDIQDYQAWMQRWVTGVNDTTVLKTKPGDILTLPEGATAGQFEGADLAPLLDSTEKRLARLASRNRIPVHLMVSGGAGSLPSGETLKTAYAPLVKATNACQTPVGHRWARVLELHYRVQCAFGDPPNIEMEAQEEPTPESAGPPAPPDPAKAVADRLTAAVDRTPPAPPKLETVQVVLSPDDVVDVLWVNPEPRNELEEATMYESRIRSGLSKATALREMGYDAEEEATQRRDEQEMSAEAAMNAFDRGLVPGVGGGRDVPPGGGSQ